MGSGTRIRIPPLATRRFYGDSAVSLRLQVTPREALVYVDGYRCRCRGRLRRCVPTAPAGARPSRDRHLSRGSSHAAAKHLSQPGIDAHDPPHARPASRRRTTRAAAGAAPDACISGSSRPACYRSSWSRWCGHACGDAGASGAAGRCVRDRRRRSMERTADPGSARHSTERRIASRPRGEGRFPGFHGRSRRARWRNESFNVSLLAQ